eukprot:NODE_1712_length_760_cov_108.243286_g1663_i0.p1 GENE.NODE_1712_length_760_cov_108.243286_g1663_i0~~NODE_1712_length_760_cov_108.243286_g1663_i0.p1  ORF type:complete len:197 (+),score=18.91 NODE_1712_length_760_cov_108.243286_g1663_i0:98-688(+)
MASNPHVPFDEDELHSAVRMCMLSCFPAIDNNDVMVQCVQESVAAELLDNPTTERMADRLEPLLMDQQVEGIEQAEFEAFYESVVQFLTDLLTPPEEGEDLDEGCCVMCERDMPLTRHHVIPRTTHDWMRKRFNTPREELCTTILICRPCHNAVHHARDHKALATEFNTLEKLMSLPELQRFTAWAQKQKVRTTRR